MNRFEDGIDFAKVRARRHSETTDEASTQVADHVAVEVLAEKHVESSGILHQAHAGGVDDQLFVFDVLVLGFMNLLSASNEETIALLHDVCFVEDGDFLPTATPRVFEGKLCNSI